MPNLKDTLVETGSYAVIKGSLRGEPLRELRKPMDLVVEAGLVYGYDYFPMPVYIPQSFLQGRGQEVQKALVLSGTKVAYNMFVGKAISGRKIIEELAAQGLALEASRFIKPMF